MSAGYFVRLDAETFGNKVILMAGNDFAIAIYQSITFYNLQLQTAKVQTITTLNMTLQTL